MYRLFRFSIESQKTYYCIALEVMVPSYSTRGKVSLGKSVTSEKAEVSQKENGTLLLGHYCKSKTDISNT